MKLLLVMLSLTFFPTVVLAHQGNLDSAGKHTCRTNCELYGLDYGEYHDHTKEEREVRVEDLQALIIDENVAIETLKVEKAQVFALHTLALTALQRGYDHEVSEAVRDLTERGLIQVQDVTAGVFAEIKAAYEQRVKEKEVEYNILDDEAQKKIDSKYAVIESYKSEIEGLLVIEDEKVGLVVEESQPQKVNDKQALHRFYSSTFKGHFYTTSVPEKQTLQLTDDNWNYEGEAYDVETTETVGNLPIYRFYSEVFKGHFYTISETEKNTLTATDPNWAYEGIAYYAYATQEKDMNPIYRFWSDAYKHHFYTTSLQEKEGLEANDPNWSYEGIAWYVK